MTHATNRLIGLALAAAAGVGTLFVDENANPRVTGSLVSQAHAVIGRPLTPMSYAGVARRPAPTRHRWWLRRPACRPWTLTVASTRAARDRACVRRRFGARMVARHDRFGRARLGVARPPKSESRSARPPAEAPARRTSHGSAGPSSAPRRGG